MSAEHDKDTRNALTKKAGLRFNVNTVKKDMGKFYKNSDLLFDVEVKDENGDVTNERKPPMYRAAHVAISAALEQLTTLILHNVLGFTNQDKTSIRTVTRPVLKYSVFLHSGLNQYYNYALNNSFNKNVVYKAQVPITDDEMSVVTDAVNRHFKFTNKGSNLLYFLLSTAYLDILRTAYDLIFFAKKRTLDPTAIATAIRLRFPDNVSHELCTELSRACAAVGNDPDEVDDDDAGDDESEKKTTSSKKKASKSNREAKIEQSDEEFEEGSDDELEEDSDELEEDSEEEVVETKPKKKTGKKKATGKKRNSRRA